MKEYRNFVSEKHIHMTPIVSDYKTFLENNQPQSDTPSEDGKDVKIFYTMETKRIGIPAGSDRGISKDDKRSTFDKIFKRIKDEESFVNFCSVADAVYANEIKGALVKQNVNREALIKNLLKICEEFNPGSKKID